MTPAERARQIDKEEFEAECAAIRQRELALTEPPGARMGRFAHGRPGVVSDFTPFEGTGGGSHA